MKKLFLLGLTLILFFNCEKPKQRYFSESPEISSMKASITEYNNGDWESWRTHFADTAKLYINSLKSISTSDLENAQKEMLLSFSTYGFQDKGSFVEMVIDSTEKTWVNYWANWHGTLKDNGKEIDVPVHITAQYIDGKVVKMYDYYDSNPITVALAEIEAANALPVDEKAMMDKLDSYISEFFNKRDNTVLSNILTDNYIRYMNREKVASNPKELVASLDVFFTGFPDLKISILHKSIKDNTVFLHWGFEGTNTGEFAGYPASGKKAKTEGLSRLHFNGEGKIDIENVYFDQLDLMQQLGITLAPPAP